MRKVPGSETPSEKKVAYFIVNLVDNGAHIAQHEHHLDAPHDRSVSITRVTIDDSEDS